MKWRHSWVSSGKSSRMAHDISHLLQLSPSNEQEPPQGIQHTPPAHPGMAVLLVQWGNNGTERQSPDPPFTSTMFVVKI